MRTAIKGRSQQPYARVKPLKLVAKVKTLPAPTKGWNTRDALADMGVGYAIVLDNFVCTERGTELRFGVSQHATDVGTFVESLMEYAPPSGANKLFAGSTTVIYDVTAAAAGTSVVTGLANGRWQDTMFATSGGNFLCIVNGADNYRTYNGTTWTDQGAAITGVTSSDLINISSHQNRLWFVEKNKLDAWYLPLSAITGAATKFPLGALCKMGGYLVAIGTWTRDGGAGMDDVWVAVTSKGQVIAYEGTDPASASTWSLIGVFQIAEPIGRRCLIKAGSDIGVITSQGVQLMSTIIERNISGQALLAITDAISGSFQEAYRTSGSNHGWQIIEYPRDQLVIVNVPIAERVTQHQYVINIRTGGWTRWKNINVGCWGKKGDRIYAGDNSGTVWLYGDDYLDHDQTITASIQLAFTNCGTPQNKRFVSARPLFSGPEGYTPTVEMKIDYDTSPATLPASVTSTSGSAWDTSPWDTSPWAGGAVPRSSWQTVTGLGQVGSPATTISLSQQFILNSIDVMYEVGSFN